MEHIENGYLKYNKIIPQGEPTIQEDNSETKLVSRNINVSGTLDGKEFDVKLNVAERWTFKADQWELVWRESKKREQ